MFCVMGTIQLLYGLVLLAVFLFKAEMVIIFHIYFILLIKSEFNQFIAGI